MDTGKAIFLGLALIALAIFAADVMRPAQAGLMGGGRYMGVPSANGSIWIVDTEKGSKQFCGLLASKCDEWME